MTLYEINEAILNCIDQETGEIIDETALNNLQMAKDEKIESVALWIKDLNAENTALKAEEDTLTKRRKTNEAKIESLKKWLTEALEGNKFKTAKCAITYNTSHAVEVGDYFCDWAILNDRTDLISYGDPKPNKTAIKAALAAGDIIKDAQIIEKKSTIIK